MPLAYHLILGMYGFWPPNDPRGSGSRYVGSRALRRFGEATKVTAEQTIIQPLTKVRGCWHRLCR